MPKTLKQMNIDELTAKQAEISRQRSELKKEAMEVARALDDRLTEKAAADKVARMGPAEKQKIARLIAAESIKSGEDSGEPGVE